MLRILPWALLVVSLLLNAGFLLGVMQAQERAEHFAQAPEARAQEVSERLALTDEQQAELEQLRASLQEKRGEEQSDSQRQERRRRVLEELLKPSYDQATVTQILDSQRQERVARWVAMGAEVHGFLQQLEADQRDAFATLAGEERGFLRALLFPQSPSRN